MAVEIKVAVVGEADYSVGITQGLIGYVQFVAIGETVGDGNLKVSRIALLTVGRQAGETDEIFPGFGLPDIFVKSLFASVQMVFAIVGKETVFPTAQ